MIHQTNLIFNGSYEIGREKNLEDLLKNKANPNIHPIDEVPPLMSSIEGGWYIWNIISILFYCRLTLYLYSHN